MRDWQRTIEQGAGSEELVWSLPELYACFQLDPIAAPDSEGLQEISLSARGTGPDGGMGTRVLESFRFVGSWDTGQERFRSIEVEGRIRNLDKDIEQVVTLRRRLIEVVQLDSAATLRSLARAVSDAQSGAEAQALAAYRQLLSQLNEELALSSAEHFAGVARRAAGVAWQETELEAALALAQSEQKAVLLLLDQENCPPCAMLHRNGLTEPSFAAASERFLPVHRDFCASPGLIERYELRGTPTLLILDGEGNKLAELVGAQSLKAGLQFLEQGQAAFEASE